MTQEFPVTLIPENNPPLLKTIPNLLMIINAGSFIKTDQLGQYSTINGIKNESDKLKRVDHRTISFVILALVSSP